MRPKTGSGLALIVGAAALAACGGDPTEPAAPLVIETTSLPAAIEGEPYSAGVDASGGAGGYAWSVVSGSLPVGLALSTEDLDDEDLLITGTPERTQISTFTLEVRSEDGQTATRELTIDVTPPPSPPSIVNFGLPPALIEAVYAVQLRGQGGRDTSYVFTVTSGQLPPGLTLGSSGTFSGTPTTTGTYTFTVQIQSGSETGSKTFVLRVVPDDIARYNITEFPIVAIPADIRPHVDTAIARWERIITSDLGAVAIPDFRTGWCAGFGEATEGAAVDDLLLLINIAPIEEPNVIGQAGPCAARNSNILPYVGVLTLDSDFLRQGVGTEEVTDLIMHEIGHVLGIGSLWEQHGLIDGAGTGSPIFTGAQAVAAYREIGGSGDAVPVENTGGAGSRDAHWEQDIFGIELMTRALDPGNNPTSKVTIASLGDLGYAVDMTEAESFTITSSVLRSLMAAERPASVGRDEVLQIPIMIHRESAERRRNP